MNSLSPEQLVCEINRLQNLLLEVREALRDTAEREGGALHQKAYQAYEKICATHPKQSLP